MIHTLTESTQTKTTQHKQKQNTSKTKHKQKLLTKETLKTQFAFKHTHTLSLSLTIKSLTNKRHVDQIFSFHTDVANRHSAGSKLFQLRWGSQETDLLVTFYRHRSAIPHVLALIHRYQSREHASLLRLLLVLQREILLRGYHFIRCQAIAQYEEIGTDVKIKTATTFKA